MKKHNPADNGVHLPFNEQSFIDKWQEWLQYRAERRLPRYVPTGLKKTFTKLLKDSNNDSQIAIQIIDHSISQNWAGLFPVKNQNYGKVNTGYFNAKPIPQIVPEGGFGKL